jgi:hypothetical protein
MICKKPVMSGKKRFSGLSFHLEHRISTGVCFSCRDISIFRCLLVKKKKEIKTHIYHTFTTRTRTCSCAVDLPHVRLCCTVSLEGVDVLDELFHLVGGHRLG